MSIRRVLLSLSIVMSLGLAASASAVDTAQDDARDALRLEAARANAGKSVQTVRFLRPVHSFEVLDGQNILVWETNTKAWLVDLRKSPACRASDLDNGIAIGLEASYDTMNTRNGYVVGENNLRCKITQLREVDVPAMRAAERAAAVATTD